MRAPVEFVVARHLLSHPEDGPADLARHARLHPASASRALKRLRRGGIRSDRQLLAHLRRLAESPHPKTIGFRAPNPEQFLAALSAPYLLSGEGAAALEGLDLVPERQLLYVSAEQWPAVAEAAGKVFAKVAPAALANVLVREADPWLCADESGRLVERGQRLLDYEESNHIQLVRGLRELG